MTDIKRGASIIVATPGRLMDLINRRAISLADVEYVVLDEADEMLNMGFKEDIDAILETTPDTKNVWLFSATMPSEVARIAKNYMTDPLEVSIGHKNQSNENIDHIYYVVKEKDRYAGVKRLIDFNPEIYGLIFCRTRQETATVAEKLGKEGYSAEPLHGDLSQVQRDRVMDRFRKKDIQILVATDVAARGLDIDNITHVINYNLPDDIENYTHRSGRTARAGRKGESLVLINTRESGKIRAIEKQMRTTFTLGTVPNAEEIISYKMPAYKYYECLVYFAGYKNHIGFYPKGSGIAAFEKESHRAEDSPVGIDRKSSTTPPAPITSWLTFHESQSRSQLAIRRRKEPQDLSA
jgi:ATP-dependent RNA helicase DeaD